MVRGVVDGCGLYDTIPAGGTSDLWLEITPQSFNVRLRKGLALTQLMLFTSDPELIQSKGNEEEQDTKIVVDDKKAPSILFDEDSKAIPMTLHRGAVVLSLRVPSENSKELCGYEAKHTNEVVDLSKIGKHERDDFFRPICSSGKGT